MQELAGPNSVNYHAQLWHAPPKSTAETVPPVAAASSGGQATDWSPGGQSRQPVAEVQNNTPKTEDIGPVIPKLTGPTPAFEANILEVESDLRQVIARMESAREGAWLHDEPKAGKAETPTVSDTSAKADASSEALTDAAPRHEPAVNDTASDDNAPRPEAETLASLSVT